MRTPGVRRWMGLSALAVALFLTIEVAAKLTTGRRPDLDDSEALVSHVQETSGPIFLVIFADTFLMASLIVFLACFRQLVTTARPELQWIADIFFGAGIAFVSVTLVGDAMDGGAALDVIGLEPDPSAIRALIEGHAILFGSAGAVLLALVSGTGALLTFASGVVPRWTGTLAVLTSLSNLAWAPMGFTGTSPDSFFASGGFGNAMLAVFPWLLWVICVGVATIRGRRSGRSLSGAPRGIGETALG
ncbi:hypothetical protein [Herbiconiux ginsengi]|uniref:DUF4386 family protein n=1 Tax=Herbiconiux ginsengi TaxID=381665 RepID=A0A1H3TFD2_9MICO|nr:hypothetical protein [Herbiconiux ginsengi]SDZ48059.1 hypothetical protein SAMN05216554_4085 [Herbiconiux ginsengi]